MGIIRLYKLLHDQTFYFNYKKSHSILLITIWSANYEFTATDTPVSNGDTGRENDGGHLEIVV